MKASMEGSHYEENTFNIKNVCSITLNGLLYLSHYR